MLVFPCCPQSCDNLTTQYLHAVRPSTAGLSCCTQMRRCWSGIWLAVVDPYAKKEKHHRSWRSLSVPYVWSSLESLRLSGKKNGVINNCCSCASIVVALHLDSWWTCVSSHELAPLVRRNC
jgi:hypothetical protein